MRIALRATDRLPPFGVGRRKASIPGAPTSESVSDRRSEFSGPRVGISDRAQFEPDSLPDGVSDRDSRRRPRRRDASGPPGRRHRGRWRTLGDVMDISTTDTSAPRARQLRDEPRSGRYPTRGYQQRQPSLERGVADQADLKNGSTERARSEENSRKTLRRDRSGHLPSDSHISVRVSAAAAIMIALAAVGCKRLLAG